MKTPVSNDRRFALWPLPITMAPVRDACERQRSPWPPPPATTYIQKGTERDLGPVRNITSMTPFRLKEPVRLPAKGRFGARARHTISR